MRKHHAMLGLVVGVVAASLITQAGVATAGTDRAWDLQGLSGDLDLEGFAGYQTTSADRDASVIITVPDAESCEFAPELTQTRSFMGLMSESAFASGVVNALCLPGEPGAYFAAAETGDGGLVILPDPSPGDRIKIVITDDGESTTVTVTNLTAGGSETASTASVPDNYEVGIQVVAPVQLVDSTVLFTKNRVDGAKLKVKDPTKITFSEDGFPKFKPTRLKRGVSFNVKSS